MKRSTRIATATAIGAAALAAAILPATGALAATATGPSGSATVAVTVESTLSLALTSPASFSLVPGLTDTGAVTFVVITNDSSGYNVSLTAPNLVDANNSVLAASSLSYATFFNGSGVGTTQLSNTGGTFFTSLHSTAGDNFSQDFTANLPGNTPPGTYATALQYIAAAD